MKDMDPLWYKDAIFYEVHVRGFQDSTNDGNGDLPGLTARLDYLHDRGVNCLWLMPIYESPLKDDGYDISDFRRIHSSIGSVDDFEILTRAAHQRGIRVIADLVISHTSDRHPWFQEARSNRSSRSPTSLLNWLRRLIHVRKKYPLFARGSLRFVPCENQRVVAYVREHAGMAALIVNNLSRFAQPVLLDLQPFEGLTPVEMFGNHSFPPVGKKPYFLSLSPHGFFWFLLKNR